MEVHQLVPGQAFELGGDVQGVHPAVAEPFGQFGVVLLDDVVLEVRNLKRELGVGEVQEEGAVDDPHLNRHQVFVEAA
jgi:hypothetical protein